jgi:hypothetical protein
MAFLARRLREERREFFRGLGWLWMRHLLDREPGKWVYFPNDRVVAVNRIELMEPFLHFLTDQLVNDKLHTGLNKIRKAGKVPRYLIPQLDQRARDYTLP